MRGITTAGATADPRPRGRLRPVLLSVLVLPGLGQLVLRRPWRGLFFSASSLALVAGVLVRVSRETQRLMPVDPEDLVDPALPFRLVAEIHRANASFFFWATLGIVALWLWAIVDACLPRNTVGPVPREPDQTRHPSAPRRPGAEG